MTKPLNAIDISPRIVPIPPVADQTRMRPSSPDELEGALADATRFDGLPPTPPAEVMAEIDAAFDRLEGLRAEQVSLRFEMGEGQRVRIEVVGEDGEVRRRIPATEAMEIAAGERPALPPERPTDADEPLRFDREA